MNLIDYCKQLYRRHKLIKEVKSYQDLPFNWDGADSIPSNEVHLKDVIKLIKEFPLEIDLPKPMCNQFGKIGFYWDDQFIYMDLEFSDCNLFVSIHYRYKGIQQEYYKENLPIELVYYTLKNIFDVKIYGLGVLNK